MTVGALTEPPVRHVPGEVGLWVFLFGDMAVFGVFFATFLHERSRDPALFHVARHQLEIGIGLTNTVVLLTGSWCVATALRVLRAGERVRAAGLFRAGAASGVVFIGLKATEYTVLGRAGHGPGTNHFFLYYFILTGIHLFHVLLGTVALLVVVGQARRPELSPARFAFVEGGSCFWHLVDLLWIVLFPLLYLVS